MMDFTDIETIALRDVYFTRTKREGVSEDFHLRRIFREFSQKFHTPLHMVYDLPTEFVVQAWVEEFYEDCDNDALLREITATVKPIEQLLQERRKEDEVDAETYLIQRDMVESEKKMKKIEEAVKALTASVSMLKPPTHEDQKTGRRHSAEAEMSNVKVKPGERISMTFGNVDLEGDSFGLLDDPKTKP